MVKSVRRVTNVSAKEFVVAVMAHANRDDGCIDSLAEALGLTPKSAYARYAKYRREMKAATGQELPKLSQSVERKATIDWADLAAIVTGDEKEQEESDESGDESQGSNELTENEWLETVTQ